MRLPRSRAQMILGVSLLVTSIVDLATGPEVNFNIFYLAIACFGSWCVGERTGLGVGVFAVLMLAANHHFGFDQHTTQVGRATLFWNMLARCLTSIFVVAIASGLRHALDQARWSATTDPLTGVLNKAAFQRRLGALVNHAQRRGGSLVLAYVDLDGFKGVNDGFGHAAGDRLLCEFSENASDAIRAHDLFARIGGDEFVTLMTVPNCMQGDIAAERLHHRLSVILRATGHAVTCSMGAMVVPAQQVADTAKLVESADALMYEVKRGGKNALRVARLDLQPAPTGQIVLPLRADRRKDHTQMANAA